MIAILGYSTAALAVRLLPEPLADRLGIAAARLLFALRPPARRALEANLERLLGPGSGAEARRTARESFEQFALVFTDFLRLDRSDPERLERDLVVHGSEHLAAARASGRGVILISAHVGSWERGAAWLAARVPQLHVVARPHGSHLVEQFFQRRRGSWGIRSLPRRPLWREAAGALRRREWVALMADRAAPGARGVCAWAAALSRRTGALVMPAVTVRLPGGRHATFIEPPLPPERVRTLAFRDTLHQYLQRYPAQWFAFEPLPGGLT